MYQTYLLVAIDEIIDNKKHLFVRIYKKERVSIHGSYVLKKDIC